MLNHKFKKVLCELIPFKKLRSKTKRKWDVFRYNTNNYNGKFIYRGEHTNKLIADLIKTNKPCFVARFGATEMHSIAHFYRNIKKHQVKFTDRMKRDMHFVLDFSLLQMNYYHVSAVSL